MRALPVAAAALLVLTTPSAVMAQETPAPQSKALTELSEKLADPEFQDQANMMGQVLLQTMLELPIGPMADAMHKATDGQSPAIDPDARLRDLAPDAEALPEKFADKLPMALNAMSGMTEGMQAMLPLLRDMTQRMRGAMERKETTK